MSTDRGFQGYYYQQFGHAKFARSGDFRRLPAESRGVYLTLRIKAGTSRQDYGRNDGSLYRRGQRMKREQTEEYIVDEFAGIGPQKAKRIVQQLESTGLIKTTRSGYVLIAGWKEEQLAPPSPSAARKRKSRLKEDVDKAIGILHAKDGSIITNFDLEKLLRDSLKKRGVKELVKALVTAGVIVRTNGGKFLVRALIASNNDRGAARPRPPSKDGESRADMSETSPPDSRERSKEEDNINRVRVECPPNGSCSEPPGPRTANRGAGASRSRAPADPRDVDVYKEHPIRAAMLLTGESGPRFERGFLKKLERLQETYGHDAGEQVFQECLSELKADLMQKRPVKNPGAVLHSKLEERIPETTPQEENAS